MGARWYLVKETCATPHEGIAPQRASGGISRMADLTILGRNTPAGIRLALQSIPRPIARLVEAPRARLILP
jgi:hypothetical protein